jgi:hypothetical protein
LATTRVLSTKPLPRLADDTLGRSNSRASDSALGQKCRDTCFKVGAVYDTDICGGDAAMPIDQIRDRLRVDRVAFRDHLVAHQDGLINLVRFGERINRGSRPTGTFQIFVGNVHGDANHGKPSTGVGMVNFDE